MSCEFNISLICGEYVVDLDELKNFLEYTDYSLKYPLNYIVVKYFENENEQEDNEKIFLSVKECIGYLEYKLPQTSVQENKPLFEKIRNLHEYLTKKYPQK